MSTLSASSSCDIKAGPDVARSHRAEAPSPTPPTALELRGSRSKPSSSGHKSLSSNAPPEAQRPLAIHSASVTDVQRPDNQSRRGKRLSPPSSSSMPPPDFVPLRPRSNSAASSGEPSHVQQARAGPLRPEPSATDSGAVLSLDDVTQKRVGGARRVLRPEVAAPQTVEKLPATRGPVRPQSRNSDEPVLSVVQQVPSVSTATHNPPPKSKEPAVLDKRPVQSRLADKSSKQQKRNVEDYKHAGDRLSKPTMSQMARMKPSVTTTRKREETKKVTKASSRVKTIPGTKLNPSSSRSQPSTSNTDSPPESDIVPAAAVALPPSPTDARASQPEQRGATSDDQTEAVGEELNEPTQTSLPITPSTPPNKSSQAFQIEQTPISALFESIREGFVFTTGLPPLELGEEYEETDRDDTCVAETINPLHVAPLTWGQKSMPQC